MEVGGDANDKSVSVKWISVGSALSGARHRHWGYGLVLEGVRGGREWWWWRGERESSSDGDGAPCQSVAGVLASERG